MTDVGYMESNPHGDGKNLTWDDLRVAMWSRGDPNRPEMYVRGLTSAERDRLGRAWARENGWRLTDAEREQVARTWLRENDAVMVTRSQLESWLSDSDQQYDLEAAFERLLDALDGGQT